MSTRSVSPGAEVQGRDHPSGVGEGQAVALQALHDEALAAEEADAEALLEGDADGHAAGRAEERVLLADHLAPELARSRGMMRPG